MRKKDVQKELNRLGYDVELHDRPLTPDLPEGLYAVDNMKLRLTPEARAELDERDRLRRESSEPTGSVATTKARIATVADMIRADKPKKYSVEQVIEFITTYVIEGTFIAVTRAHGVPYQTIQEWEKSRPWFNELVNYIKNTTDHQLEARMTEIVDLTTTALVDRIKNGDTGIHQGAVVEYEIEDEEGNLQSITSKIPLTADQLARIGAIYFDKRQIARGMDVKNQSTAIQTVEDKLRAIASRMQDIAENMPSGNIINVTPEA